MGIKAWGVRRHSHVMQYQLVIQVPGDSFAQHNAIIALEDELIEELGDSAEVDGHEAGSGETGIFILTSDPIATFQRAKRVLERAQWLQTATVAYREMDEEGYTVLWPEDSEPELSVASYAEEYREWIRKGGFREVYGRAISDLPNALKQEHPALVALNLSSIATCYYMRGVVAVLDGKQNGWRDIQCGYWASVEMLRFEIKSVTLPAWSAGRSFLASSQLELVLTLGLARLFRQEVDASWLSSAIATHFHPEEALGTKISHGRLLLESILKPEENFSFSDLLRDRNQCCSKRDEWPKRPTEIVPFGVLDIEAVLRFPAQASFQYPESLGFNPTEENAIGECVIAYGNWYE